MYARLGKLGGSNWFKDAYCAIGVDEPGSMCRLYKEHEDLLAAGFEAPPRPRTPVVPPVDPTTGLTTWTVDQIIAETKRQQDADALRFFQNAERPKPEDSESGTLIMIGVAIAATLLLTR